MVDAFRVAEDDLDVSPLGGHDLAANISPGPYPVAAHPAAGLDAVPFPPKQTTICPLGPSSVAPIASTIRRFRHEYEAKITKRDTIPVSAAPVEVVS